MVIAFLDIIDEPAHPAQPCLVGVAADVDRLGVHGLARRYAAHLDIDVEDQVAHLLHPAQRDALGTECFADVDLAAVAPAQLVGSLQPLDELRRGSAIEQDRKSTRLNSSHEWISYAVFCLKKKKTKNKQKKKKKE